MFAGLSVSIVFMPDAVWMLTYFIYISYISCLCLWRNLLVICWMSPDSPQKMSTRGPLWCFCVGHTSRERRASAAADTWPTMKWRSSCSCQTFSKCRSQSPVRSTSTAGPAASRCPASKVGRTDRSFNEDSVILVQFMPSCWGRSGRDTDKCCPLVEQLLLK